MLGFEKVAKLIERQVIEVAPLAYMRGRTLNHSFVILDEAQNTTPEQMKMFLTRLGYDSKMVITGDERQSDLKVPVNGLVWASERMGGKTGEIAVTEFSSKNIVRNPLIEKMLQYLDGPAPRFFENVGRMPQPKLA
jgi:phosphate starvation-inducible PhoH-like protein